MITAAVIVTGVAFAIGGCSFTEKPRWRLGSYATTTLGTRFIDANDLGKHSFHGSLTENNGIAYTCRGGHIDVTHVRIAADYVRYLYNKTRKYLLTDTSEFTFKSDEEPSVYFVQLKYPDNWQTLPPQDTSTACNQSYIKYNRINS